MSQNTISSQQLRSYIDRIERMEQEKKSIADDIKDIYVEAKSNGYDTKTLREIIRRRKMDRADLEKQEAILETYMAALGMLPDQKEAA